MGGPLVMRTAASNPERVGAGASFHGGGLVTDQPSSPHLLVPKIRARMYFAVAASDDARQPDAKDILRAAFQAAKGTAEIEVYAGTQHGWCCRTCRRKPVRRSGSWPDAGARLGQLLELYRAALTDSVDQSSEPGGGWRSPGNEHSAAGAVLYSASARLRRGPDPPELTTAIGTGKSVDPFDLISIHTRAFR
jgi:hypothetical protein